MYIIFSFYFANCCQNAEVPIVGLPRAYYCSHTNFHKQTNRDNHGIINPWPVKETIARLSKQFQDWSQQVGISCGIFVSKQANANLYQHRTPMNSL